MKVIQIAPLQPYRGGAETIAGQLSENLLEQGHDVTWYCLNSAGRRNETETVNGIRVKKFKPLFLDPLYIPGLKFISDLKREEADLVHVHNLHTLIPAIAIFCRKNTGSKIVFQPHYHARGQNLFRSLLLSVYKVLLKSLLSRHVDAVVVNSEYEKKTFSRDFPGMSARTVLIPEVYSIEIPAGVVWRPQKKPRKILYVGALRTYKNVDKLMRAYSLLISRFDDLELTIVGDGEEKENLVRLAKELDIEKFLVWKKDLTYDQLMQEYVEASVVVLLSSLESFSRVAHEAIAVGTPLVVYDYGVLGELVMEGLVASAQDLAPATVAGAVRTVLEEQRKPAGAGRPRERESYAGHFIKLYESLSGTI